MPPKKILNHGPVWGDQSKLTKNAQVTPSCRKYFPLRRPTKAISHQELCVRKLGIVAVRAQNDCGTIRRLNQGDTMSSVTLKLELPEDWKQLSFPPALDNRLQYLLDQQDRGHTLSDEERSEAEALCNLVDMLALLKLRAEQAAE